MKISAAGNTEVPAYLALVELGFEITTSSHGNEVESWIARNGETELIGDGPFELLALVKLIECRGKNWKASDEEIDDFVGKYC